MRKWVLLACAATLFISGCWQRDVGRSYYPSGKLRSESTVRNNVLDGHAVMYAEDGKKISEADYRAGTLHGKAVSYYESGSRKAEAGYRDGMLHGTSTSWSEAGAVKDTVTFQDGRLVVPAQQPAGEKGAVTK
jgi:antitoxin component YwqK of YwqJK toxin-antitoxin module